MSLDTTNRVTIEEDKAAKLLIKKVLKQKGKYHYIATTGRGGLSIAQKLAYALDIPVRVLLLHEVVHLDSSVLFVDDIVCTGETISCIPRSVDVATLVLRDSALYKPTYFGHLYKGDEYIKFSWEVN